METKQGIHRELDKSAACSATGNQTRKKVSQETRGSGDRPRRLFLAIFVMQYDSLQQISDSSLLAVGLSCFEG